MGNGRNKPLTQVERNRRWRERAKRQIRNDLGNRCWQCGLFGEYDGDKFNLYFAHIIPLSEEQESYRTKVGAHGRILLYRREHAEGLLKLLCPSCNRKEANSPKQGWLTLGALVRLRHMQTQPF